MVTCTCTLYVPRYKVGWRCNPAGYYWTACMGGQGTHKCARLDAVFADVWGLHESTICQCYFKKIVIVY